jgi:monovalent cation:H+ antiporter, CPA1 family
VILAITYVVVVFSIMVQGLTIGPLIQKSIAEVEEVEEG